MRLTNDKLPPKKNKTLHLLDKSPNNMRQRLKISLPTVVLNLNSLPLSNSFDDIPSIPQQMAIVEQHAPKHVIHGFTCQSAYLIATLENRSP